jgi:D-glycero-alpha-D-manno-heptose-7-phosphate kinase
MYISIHPYFEEDITLLKYYESEKVYNINDIRHRIIREALLEKGIKGVEITSTADIPSGTGLGSSSSFTVGLFHALNSYSGQYTSKKDLAEEACNLEIERLGNPIGKQDQYAAAYGGLNFLSFHENGEVSVEPVVMEKKTFNELKNNLVLYYTGLKHDANEILSEQKKNIAKKIDNLMVMKNLAILLRKSLENNNLDDFGSILDEGWKRKKELTNNISNGMIDDLYYIAKENGAKGGKLLGAGGGGFLLFYCDYSKQDYLTKKIGLKPMQVKFDQDGSIVVYDGGKYW